MTTYEQLAVFAQILLILFACSVLLWLSLDKILQHSGRLSPVFVDGALYFLMGVWGAIMVICQNDDVYKYCSPYFVFYLKSVSSVALAGATSIKTFRSTGYSQHLEEKKRTGQTDFINRPPPVT